MPNATRKPRPRSAATRTRRGVARAPKRPAAPRWEPNRPLLRRLPLVDLYAEARAVVRDLTPLLPAEHDDRGAFLDILARTTSMVAVFKVGGTPEYPLSSKHPALLLYSLLAAENALRAEHRVGIQTRLDFMHDPRPEPNSPT